MEAAIPCLFKKKKGSKRKSADEAVITVDDENTINRPNKLRQAVMVINHGSA